MKHISSRENAQFKALRALADDPRESKRQNRVLLDGIHLLRVCMERRIPLLQLIVNEAAAGNPEICVLLEANPAIEVLQLSDALFRSVSPVASPVGIAGLMAIPADATDEIETDAVILDGVQDAGNVGAILRTAAAAGVAHAVLGKGCAGVWTPRVLRAAQGAHFALSIREGIDLDACLGARPRLAACALATVAREAESLYDLDLGSAGQLVWLFGNEGAGLAPSLIALAGRRVTIPLQAATESLNVAAAAAVCLFEAVRQRRHTSTDS